MRLNFGNKEFTIGSRAKRDTGYLHDVSIAPEVLVLDIKQIISQTSIRCLGETAEETVKMIRTPFIVRITSHNCISNQSPLFEKKSCHFHLIYGNLFQLGLGVLMLVSFVLCGDDGSYKHDPSGDTFLPYKHDTAGDQALPYKHDPSGDKGLPYKHDSSGDTRQHGMTLQESRLFPTNVKPVEIRTSPTNMT